MPSFEMKALGSDKGSDPFGVAARMDMLTAVC